ncbi:MAG: hypothetical protein JRC87_05600 [Deltaproteobacteria bacterium]|nr:hypothetical protein [Deltaproteobacteria bacterium]
MRCPKCGFISFDHLEVCLKCKKDIKAASDALNGGVLQVVPPVFLNLQPEPEAGQPDKGDFITDSEDVVDEYVDSDLDILLEDELEEVSDGVVFEEEEDEPVDLDLSMDDEDDGEIAIDLGGDDEVAIHLDEFADDQGDDGEVLAGQSESNTAGGDDGFEIEMPEELIDMSDLAPPASAGDDGAAAESLDLDINLDDFDFELESSAPDGGQSAEEADSGETVLALDDIDFSDTLGNPEKKSRKKAGEVDMDEELNFDLDLGGLSIHDDNL